MPELPEVETIKIFLSKVLVGKKIKTVEVRLLKIFHGKESDIKEKTIERIERRGKILIVRLSGDKSLLFHFKLTGQLVWVPDTEKRTTLGHPFPLAGSKLPDKTTHVIFRIDGGKLFFNDLRKFGWIKVVDNKNWQLEDKFTKMGPEPFAKDFTREYLQKIFSKTSKPIKLVLMDQDKIAGIGNIYANEALFEAGIDPRRPARTFVAKEIDRLRKSIRLVLKEGLKYGGSSAKDEAYIKPTGELGNYQDHFRVYQRDGKKCPKCSRLIQRIKIGGRGTFFCQNCQE